VAALQKQVDALSKEIRELEMKLQEANWSVDLVE
jgi:septicolysin